MAQALPGGFSTLTFTLPAMYRQTIQAGDHIEVFAEGVGVAWEGMRSMPRMTGYDQTQIQARGYYFGLCDTNPLETPVTTNTTKMPADQCLALALRSASGLITTSTGPEWQAPSLFHALSDFNGRTASQVADQIFTETGYDLTIGLGRLAHLKPRTPPSPTQYQIPISACPDWEEDDTTLATEVEVQYTDIETGVAGTKTAGPNLNAEAMYGVHRKQILQVGTMSAGAAAATAQTQLAILSQITVRASFQAPYVTRPLGAPTPACDVQAGEWVQIGGASEDRAAQVIVTSTVDLKTGVGTFQLGQRRLDVLGRLVSLTNAVKAVKTATNVLSGAPN